MNEQNRILEMDINESMAALISFFDNIKINISIFRHEFTKAYESFTKKASASLTDRNKRIRTDDHKYSNVTDLYKFFMILLTNFMNSFTREYTETLSMAIDISNLKESYKDIFMRYFNFDDMDVDHLYRLDKKVRRIIDRHNKLALKYNARIRHFETLRRNILNGTLVYNSDKKRFAVSVSDKLIRFQQIIASDVKFRRIPVNIGSVQQFPQAMENTASQFQFAEISPLGESNLRFLPRQTPKGRKRKAEESDSDRSGSEVQEESPIVRRRARRTKDHEVVKHLDDRKKEVEDLMKTIVPYQCQNLLAQTLDNLKAILPYKIEIFVDYIKILKEDQGVAKTSTIVEDILRRPNIRFPPIRTFGITNPQGDLNPSVKTNPPPQMKKRAREYALNKEYNCLKAENDIKIKILKEGITELEAFGKSVDLLYLLDDNYILEDCNEFIGNLCEFLLTAFEQARNKFPSVLKKIHINDNPPLGDRKDYHNRSSDAKELLVERDQLECQMRNSFRLYDNAVKKRYPSSITDAEIKKIQIMKDRIAIFVESCVQNINDKIQDLEQEVKVVDAKIRVIDKENKRDAAIRRKKLLYKIDAEAAATAAKTAADEAVAAAATAAAAATSGDSAAAVAAAVTAAAAASAASKASAAAAKAIRESASVTSNKAAATSSKATTTSGRATIANKIVARAASAAAKAAAAANAAAASAATFGYVPATSHDPAAAIPDDVAATSGDAATATAATSDDDGVNTADDNAMSDDDTNTPAAAAASSARKDSPYIYARNPTTVSKDYRYTRLTTKHASNIKSYDPELLSKVADELEIKIFNQAQEQTQKKILRSKSKKYKTMGDCRNIHLMYEKFDDDFKKFLEDWKDKIKIDNMDITDYNEISEIQKKLEYIEKTGKLVNKSSEIALSLVLRRPFDDDEELVNLQIEYLSLALILGYLQVQYYDYQRDKVIQSTIKNKDSKVDELTGEIEYADKCLQLIIVKLEKFIPE